MGTCLTAKQTESTTSDSDSRRMCLFAAEEVSSTAKSLGTDEANFAVYQNAALDYSDESSSRLLLLSSAESSACSSAVCSCGCANNSCTASTVCLVTTSPCCAASFAEGDKRQPNDDLPATITYGGECGKNAQPHRQFVDARNSDLSLPQSVYLPDGEEMYFSAACLRHARRQPTDKTNKSRDASAQFRLQQSLLQQQQKRHSSSDSMPVTGHENSAPSFAVDPKTAKAENSAASVSHLSAASSEATVGKPVALVARSNKMNKSLPTTMTSSNDASVVAASSPAALATSVSSSALCSLLSSSAPSVQRWPDEYFGTCVIAPPNKTAFDAAVMTAVEQSSDSVFFADAAVDRRGSQPPPQPPPLAGGRPLAVVVNQQQQRSMSFRSGKDCATNGGFSSGSVGSLLPLLRTTSSAPSSTTSSSNVAASSSADLIGNCSPRTHCSSLSDSDIVVMSAAAEHHRFAAATTACAVGGGDRPLDSKSAYREKPSRRKKSAPSGGCSSRAASVANDSSSPNVQRRKGNRGGQTSPTAILRAAFGSCSNGYHQAKHGGGNSVAPTTTAVSDAMTASAKLASKLDWMSSFAPPLPTNGGCGHNSKRALPPGEHHHHGSVTKSVIKKAEKKLSSYFWS